MLLYLVYIGVGRYIAEFCPKLLDTLDTVAFRLYLVSISTEVLWTRRSRRAASTGVVSVGNRCSVVDGHRLKPPNSFRHVLDTMDNYSLAMMSIVSILSKFV